MIDHAYILSSYLNRITLAELEKIHASQAAIVNANMNGNLSKQLAANLVAHNTVQSAIDNLLPYDRRQLDELIK